MENNKVGVLEKEYARLESLWWLAMSEVEAQEGDGGTLDGWRDAIETEERIWRDMELTLEKINQEKQSEGGSDSNEKE